MREAILYSPAKEGFVDCHLCSFRCHIAEGRYGVCGVRENIGGVLYTHVYGKLIAEHIDPIEKKPLFHFQPGGRSYSIATVGCNFRCLHCQNSEISQMPKEKKRILGTDVTAEEVAAKAEKTGCSSISYTYTEPTIFCEFALDVGRLAKKKGIKNVFVTNGYMTKECLAALKGVLDAANVDIKSFSEAFYKKVCGARLAPVLESVERMRADGVWVEITTLIIPTLNDTEEELRSIARWIAKTDRSMPWHISAFHPSYKLMDLPPTPASIVERARDIGIEEGIKYVYTGNIPGLKGESTYCPACGKLLIERWGFAVKKNLVKDAKCRYCKTPIDGVDL
ncbi:MAG: AmmeMemoRadiSam system radical SAM enzyme [Deltaproteobacteria bacterium]|nr:AmmeMemoRadiSam system radical SAM enzyme [Deltaproteobacteria bacterium]